jgi:NADH:ubiquinone reductase (H+-translocating)
MDPKVVIVGAGFGGLYCAQELKHKPVKMTVIDRNNFHTFQPLLYQVAMAGLSAGEIAAPVRAVLRGHAIVVMGEVTGFDLDRHLVHLADFDCPFDYLVVAAGASHSYFGHPEWERYAPALKTVDDAIEIRRRVLLAYENAERESLINGQHEMVNFVVVGGGPTGVELAGAIAELARVVLKNDFREIDPTRTRITLVEAGPRILATYSPDLSAKAVEQLNNIGVEVAVNSRVTEVEASGIRIDGKLLPAKVVLWAAGVQASPLGKQLGVETDRAGRVPVQPDLSLPGHPEVFVIGDLAALKDVNGVVVPGLAPAAIQEGRAAARNILRDLKGEPREPFRYLDKGTMATIGRAAAIVQIGKIKLSGFFAWLTWLFVHILMLIGFRNRLLVLMDWTWSYLSFQRGSRIIYGNQAIPWETQQQAAGAAPRPEKEVAPTPEKAA